MNETITSTTETQVATIPTISTVDAMTLVVQANPGDQAAIYALVDAMIESGKSPVAAKRAANLIVRKAEDTLRTPAAWKRWLKGCPTDAQIEAMLSAANGRRRERTLTLGDVEDAIRRVLVNNLSWKAIGGGTVANAYKYPSQQTSCVIAVRSNGTIRIAIGIVSGNKGTSLTNGVMGLTARATAEQFREWADADLAVTTPATI